MAVSTDPDPKNRSSSDRRQQPTSAWTAWFGDGQRRRNRRTSEDLQPYFVDRFSPRAFALIVTLLTLSISDAYITLILLENGCEEVNPVMNYLLELGPLSFLVGKYVLTAAGLPILLMFKNYFLFGTRFRVGYLIPGFVLMYLVLISYQFCLLYG
ncbi:MAG: hypothetical protein JWM11_6296 [Planctomycetaceae bacterium]|nr:hypothetical protein [Planctomycetaceae bacterium]